jgi:hypothetical protein
MDKVVYNHLTGKTETTTLSADEQASIYIGFESLDKKREAYKLDLIKQIRLEKLIETDYLAMSDNVLSDDMKNFRKKMRDIPQDYTTEEQYDLLLARDEQGNLTHSIWSKP